jgi:hypothetical protein
VVERVAALPGGFDGEFEALFTCPALEIAKRSTQRHVQRREWSP